jgi:hypothetical protein
MVKDVANDCVANGGDICSWVGFVVMLKEVGLPIASKTDCLTVVQRASDLLLVDLSRDFDALPFRRV